jgi:hypothetical protein
LGTIYPPWSLVCRSFVFRAMFSTQEARDEGAKVIGRFGLSTDGVIVSEALPKAKYLPLPSVSHRPKQPILRPRHLESRLTVHFRRNITFASIFQSSTGRHGQFATCASNTPARLSPLTPDRGRAVFARYRSPASDTSLQLHQRLW